MNFMTNFGLTSNTKSCAIFNSECMLVFGACSLLFREIKSKSLFIEVHYSLIINSCIHETNKIYEGNE